MTKAKPIEIKGALKFNSLDPLVARFSMEGDENLQFGKRIDIPASLITNAVKPREFDPNVHQVTGTFSFVIEVGEKK